MEIEKIISTVQEKVGKTDFSTQTIRKVVELYPVAEGEEPDDAYFEKVSSFITGMQGQYNHDFSTKFTEAKKNLLTEDTFKDMSAEQLASIKALLDKRSEGSSDDEVSKLKAEIAKLTERLDGSDSAKKQAELLVAVKAAMKEQKASDDYVLEKTLEGAVFDVNKSIDELTKEYLAKYDAEYTKCRGGGTPPRQSSGGGGGQGQTWLDQQFAKKAAKEGWARKS